MWNYPRYPRDRASQETDSCMSAFLVLGNIVGMGFLAIKAPVGFVRWIAVSIACIPILRWAMKFVSRLLLGRNNDDDCEWMGVFGPNGRVEWGALGLHAFLVIVGFWPMMTGCVGFVSAFIGIGMMLGGILKIKPSLFFKGMLAVALGAVGVAIIWFAFYVWRMK